MGSSRRRLTREDLEALRKEFDLDEMYGGGLLLQSGRPSGPAQSYEGIGGEP